MDYLRSVILGASVLAFSTAAMGQESASEPEKRGLLARSPAATAGYTLLAPLRSHTTYLVNLDGKVVHSWRDDASPGHAVHLLDNGDLLRCSRDDGQRSFHGGGQGGLIRRISWEGERVWEFDYSDATHCQHHDAKILPNGNVIFIAWEKKSREDALAAGRKTDGLSAAGVWPDCIIEFQPEGSSGGKIVWEWHAWDHLVQSADEAKLNYGKPSDRPERIDVNYVMGGPRMSPREQSRLRSLGYVGGDEPDDDDAAPQDRPAARGDRRGPPGGGPGGPPGIQSDWLHTNSLDYNAELDQIVLSVHNFNEIWVIDHSTTTAEAATSMGGRGGKGGDLLYRWGNPAAYGAGDESDRRLFGQHDATWVRGESDAAPRVLVFNNGAGRRGERYSTVDEIELPWRDGKYARDGDAFGPKQAAWSYAGEPRSAFYSGHISGAQRLPSGNTLICSGEDGRVFEVTPDKEVVWNFASPLGGEVSMGPRRGGPTGGDRGPGDGENERRRPGPAGAGGPGDGPDGRGFGPGGRDEKHALFRAVRIAPDHPALKSHGL